jgi:hypothetical protein
MLGAKKVRSTIAQCDDWMRFTYLSHLRSKLISVNSVVATICAAAFVRHSLFQSL